MQKSYAHNTAYPVLVPMSPNVGRTGRLANALHKYKAWEHRHWQGSGPKHQPRAMACYRRTMIQRVVRCEHRTMVRDVVQYCKRRAMVRDVARRSHLVQWRARRAMLLSCDARRIVRQQHRTRKTPVVRREHRTTCRCVVRARHLTMFDEHRTITKASYDPPRIVRGGVLL